MSAPPSACLELGVGVLKGWTLGVLRAQTLKGIGGGGTDIRVIYRGIHKQC